MTVGIDDGKFYLIDTWPGVPTNGPNPDSWTTYAATAAFNPGEKRAIWDDTNKGWAILIYLKYEKGTATAATVKSLCSPDTTDSAAAAGWYNVTNDGGESLNVGPIAVALGTCTDEYYGWFWCGGVCPVDTVSGLDGIFPSDGSVAAGAGMKLVDSASINKFEVCTGSEIGLASAFSLAADTTA